VACLDLDDQVAVVPWKKEGRHVQSVTSQQLPAPGDLKTSRFSPLSHLFSHRLLTSPSSYAVATSEDFNLSQPNSSP
jgi:hypothetical protein